MKVKLMGYTPHPEILCAQCASVSWRTKVPKENMTIEEAREIIKRVVGYGHESVIEHANFTFFVEGISRSLTHQLVRHRIASFTQQSMRYVNLSKSEDYFIKPESLRVKQNTISKHFMSLSEEFDEHMGKCSELYKKMVKAGIPAEDARFVLPIGSQTKIAVTMNARELRHFFTLRCCYRAQWEIRELANEMLKICKRIAPSLFEKAGPSCVKLGYCPEGELTCGKLKEVLDYHSF